MTRNAIHASRHPCYVPAGFRCDCGTRSMSLDDHRKHLIVSPKCRTANATVGDLKWLKNPDKVAEDVRKQLESPHVA